MPGAAASGLPACRVDKFVHGTKIAGKLITVPVWGLPFALAMAGLKLEEWMGRDDPD
jgi:hypothetical protein